MPSHPLLSVSRQWRMRCHGRLERSEEWTGRQAVLQVLLEGLQQLNRFQQFAVPRSDPVQCNRKSAETNRQSSDQLIECEWSWCTRQLCELLGKRGCTRAD